MERLKGKKSPFWDESLTIEERLDWLLRTMTLEEAETSTSFVQPIGMSATWDTELIQKAGEVVGKETRVIYHRHPDRGLKGMQGEHPRYLRVAATLKHFYCWRKCIR